MCTLPLPFTSVSAMDALAPVLTLIAAQPALLEQVGATGAKFTRTFRILTCFALTMMQPLTTAFSSTAFAVSRVTGPLVARLVVVGPVLLGPGHPHRSRFDHRAAPPCFAAVGQLGLFIPSSTEPVSVGSVVSSTPASAPSSDVPASVSLGGSSSGGSSPPVGPSAGSSKLGSPSPASLGVAPGSSFSEQEAMATHSRSEGVRHATWVRRGDRNDEIDDMAEPSSWCGRRLQPCLARREPLAGERAFSGYSALRRDADHCPVWREWTPPRQ